jgi:hypothetical protein
VADRRASPLGREEVLPRQSASQDGSAHVSRHDQSAMDLRTGTSAVERGTRARSLRRTILARPSSSRTHDNDRLRVPPASPTRTSGAEKKESTGLRLNRACRPYAKPSSNSSFDHDRGDARIAEDKSVKSSSVNKSAKVVLGRVLIKREMSAFEGTSSSTNAMSEKCHQRKSPTLPRSLATTAAPKRPSQ